MFGSHLSIAGSMTSALDEAVSLGLDTVQVFTKNQQQWSAKPLTQDGIDRWKARLAELGWDAEGGRTVSHASYLINLASPDPALRAKSIDLMTDEIQRCQQLGIRYLVHHPGAFTTSTREQGLRAIADAYRELFARTKGFEVISCLENTVGSGSNLGREFSELATLRDMILDATGVEERLGICIDTCHAHAGGYDLSTTASARAVLDRLDAELGLKWVRVLHVNDSKGAVGSRIDRHEHIGRGTIGDAGFRVVVGCPAFANIPKILETPKEGDCAGEPWDTVNLRHLRSVLSNTPTVCADVGQPARRTSRRDEAKAGSRPVRGRTGAASEKKNARRGRAPKAGPR